MRSSMLWLYELDANQTHFNLPHREEEHTKALPGYISPKERFRLGPSRNNR